MLFGQVEISVVFERGKFGAKKARFFRSRQKSLIQMISYALFFYCIFHLGTSSNCTEKPYSYKYIDD